MPQAILTAEQVLNGHLRLSEEEKTSVIKQLISISGYRVFSEDLFCHKVLYFDDPLKANAFGLAVSIRGDSYIGGPHNGTKCGRDKSFDKIDRAYGKVYAVTCN